MNNNRKQNRKIMATNFGIKIDLLKLKGAFMRNLKG